MSLKKEIRRHAANERKNDRAHRSPAEQLALLDDRGVTAKKERARLEKLILAVSPAKEHK